MCFVIFFTILNVQITKIRSVDSLHFNLEQVGGGTTLPTASGRRWSTTRRPGVNLGQRLPGYANHGEVDK